MTKTAFCATALLLVCTIFPGITSADNNENANPAQTDAGLPEGMELRSVGNKAGYKVVLPKGATIQKRGDLRVIEDSGEYAARRFEEYDQQLAQIITDIQSLREEIDEIKKSIGPAK